MRHAPFLPRPDRKKGGPPQSLINLFRENRSMTLDDRSRSFSHANEMFHGFSLAAFCQYLLG
jgi:hypothetical protein